MIQRIRQRLAEIRERHFAGKAMLAAAVIELPTNADENHPDFHMHASLAEQMAVYGVDVTSEP